MCLLLPIDTCAHVCVCILEFSDCKILIISIYLIIVKADILERYYKGIVFSQIVFFNFLDVYG